MSLSASTRLDPYELLCPTSVAQVPRPEVGYCAVQAHGAAGVCDDFPHAAARAHSRTIRLADSPDEVHCEAIAKLELSRAR
jgi:hypothetical protein